MVNPLEVDDGNVGSLGEGFLDLDGPKYTEDGGSSSPCYLSSSTNNNYYTTKNNSMASTPALMISRALAKLRPIVRAPAGTNEGFTRRHRRGLAAISVASVVLISAALVFVNGRKSVLRFRLDSSSSSSSSTRQFSSSSSFRIMQVTDIHLGEDEFTDWGPEQDRKTWALLDKMFDYEDPDLIVLGGDQLTANNCLGNCTEYYRILGRFLSKHGVPWATVMGNHDDMSFQPPDGGATIPHSYTRRDLLRVDQSFPLSLSGSSPAGLTGATNYVLDVLGPAGDNDDDNEIALQIFFLDSGGGSLQEAIDDGQVRWFVETAAAGAETTVPAVAFQHIPTRAHEYSDDDDGGGGGSCFGFRGEGVKELDYDGGIVDAMVESGRFSFLAVGHNHGNDYCCRYGDDANDNSNDLYFCFGRHSGYGGYGGWERGVRIFELLLADCDGNVDDGANGGDCVTGGNERRRSTEGTSYGSEKSKRTFKWRTWVRLESGEKVDFMDYDHSVTGSSENRQ